MKKQIKVIPRTLPGFMELKPNEQILFNQIKEKIEESYKRFGFLPLDTPILELSEVLLAKAGGETEKQIYRFTRGDDLAMRFDLTVPLAKYVSKNYGELQFPFRRYQIGKVYRGERPQKGRFREFYQADIDIIGDGELSIMNDAEIHTTFKNLGFDDFTIRINNRKILNGLFEYLNIVELSTEIMRIIDKLEKIGKENVKLELLKLNIEEEIVDKILEFISISGNNEEKIEALEKLNIKNEVFEKGFFELKEVIKYIRLFGVPEGNFSIDLTIARGLDYYTGTVYETFLDNYREIGSVCSGGRYDNLAENYTDKSLPGVGIAIGVTRLFDQLNDLKLIKTEKESISDVLVISTSDDVSECLPIANTFRKEGINTEVYMNDKKMKAKFKYADKLKIPYVAIIGEDELKENKVSLKNLVTGKQDTINIQEAVEILKEYNK